MTEDFRDKLISSTHPDGSRDPEPGEKRVKAAEHQSTPVYELNRTQSPIQEKQINSNGYSVRDRYINPIRRKKGLPEIK